MNLNSDHEKLFGDWKEFNTLKQKTTGCDIVLQSPKLIW